MPLLAMLSAWANGRLPSPPLFVGVEGTNYAEGTKIINDRLQAKVPKGSPARELESFFKQQGLRIARIEDPATPDGWEAP